MTAGGGAGEFDTEADARACWFADTWASRVVADGVDASPDVVSVTSGSRRTDQRSETSACAWA